MDSPIKEVRLIKSSVDENANKWWRAQLYQDGTVKAQWARVGYEKNAQNGSWTGGEKYLDKKIKEKLKKGYTYDKTVGSVIISEGSGEEVSSSKLHEIAKSQIIKTSNPVLDKLIKRLVDANIHKITSTTQISYSDSTGLFSTPLGIINSDGLTEARDILSKIAPLVRKHRYGSDLNVLVGQYLRIIPQHVGMKLVVENLFPDEDSIQKQNDLIDSLESSYQAFQTKKTSKNNSSDGSSEKVFDVELDILSDSKELDRIESWFEKSKKSEHKYSSVKVRQIFKVRINEMVSGFDKDKTPIKEVWHGSSQANCLSILKSGLKVNPPSTAKIAGKLYGCGIYGAYNSSKSMGYTFGRWNQGRGESGWLYVCEFAMGKIYETTSWGDDLPRGYDSLWAKSSTGKLYNDEFVIYKNNQCNIKYLLEIK